MKKIVFGSIFFLCLFTPFLAMAAEVDIYKPYGSYVDKKGCLYTANPFKSEIHKFDQQGDLIWTYGTYGSSSGHFRAPQGIAVDSKGNIYVADTGNHRIVKLKQSSSYPIWDRVILREVLYLPRDIFIDKKNNILIVDAKNRVLKIDKSGNSVLSFLGGTSNIFGSLGKEKGQFNDPNGIFVDKSNNIYVADSGNNRIQKFSSGGSFLLSLGTGGNGQGNFLRPSDVVVSSKNHIFVADSHNFRIQEFNGSGKFISSSKSLTHTLSIAYGKFLYVPPVSMPFPEFSVITKNNLKDKASSDLPLSTAVTVAAPDIEVEDREKAANNSNVLNSCELFINPGHTELSVYNKRAYDSFFNRINTCGIKVIIVNAYVPDGYGTGKMFINRNSGYSGNGEVVFDAETSFNLKAIIQMAKEKQISVLAGVSCFKTKQDEILDPGDICHQDHIKSVIRYLLNTYQLDGIVLNDCSYGDSFPAGSFGIDVITGFVSEVKDIVTDHRKFGALFEPSDNDIDYENNLDIFGEDYFKLSSYFDIIYVKTFQNQDKDRDGMADHQASWTGNSISYLSKRLNSQKNTILVPLIQTFDILEPWEDYNLNGSYDDGESYIDMNRNGTHDEYLTTMPENISDVLNGISFEVSKGRIGIYDDEHTKVKEWLSILRGYIGSKERENR